MFRIDNSTAAASLPTPAAAGTPGYFTDGNAATGVAATIVPADWFNMTQEELIAVLTAAGITPSKTNRAQLVAAIQALIGKAQGRLLGVQVFPASGTYTPTSGTRLILVRVLGAGGGGGSTPATTSGNCAVGSGGAAGAYVEAWFLVGSTASFAVTVGSAGAANAGTAGGTGGTSSFGSLVSAPGGGGGQVIQNATTVPAFFSGQGGASATPTVTGALTTVSYAAGQPGACGLGFAGALISGQGAPSVFGGGGNNTSSGAGTAASAPGAGGSGAATGSGGAAALGGIGGQGAVVIIEYS